MSPGAAEPGPRRRARPKVSPAPDATPADAPAVLAWLERHGTRAARDGLARYGLPSDTAYGVPVGALLGLAKQLGRWRWRDAWPHRHRPRRAGSGATPSGT